MQCHLRNCMDISQSLSEVSFVGKLAFSNLQRNEHMKSGWAVLSMG